MILGAGERMGDFRWWEHMLLLEWSGEESVEMYQTVSCMWHKANTDTKLGLGSGPWGILNRD